MSRQLAADVIGRPVNGMAPCQCPWCTEYNDDDPVPDATQEDLLCDLCREPGHKRMVAGWLAVQRAFPS